MVAKCVYCGEPQAIDNDRSFHKFPTTDSQLFRKWIENMEMGANFKLGKRSRLCSDHFEEKCFSKQIRRVLLPGSIPTKFGIYKSSCVYCHEIKGTKKDRSYRKFPVENPELLKKWLDAMNIKDLVITEKSFLCSDHFDENCFRRTGRNSSVLTLKSDAVPRLFVKNEENKIERFCCVKYCGSRETRIGSKEERRQLFQFPLNEDLQKQWIKAIGPNIKDLSGHTVKVFHVCDLHFTPDCITRNFVEELVDGTENLVKRKRIGLKSGSIPTIFKDGKFTKENVTITVVNFSTRTSTKIVCKNPYNIYGQLTKEELDWRNLSTHDDELNVSTKVKREANVDKHDDSSSLKRVKIDLENS